MTMSFLTAQKNKNHKRLSQKKKKLHTHHIAEAGQVIFDPSLLTKINLPLYRQNLLRTSSLLDGIGSKRLDKIFWKGRSSVSLGFKVRVKLLAIHFYLAKSFLSLFEFKFRVTLESSKWFLRETSSP